MPASTWLLPEIRPLPRRGIDRQGRPGNGAIHPRLGRGQALRRNRSRTALRTVPGEPARPFRIMQPSPIPLPEGAQQDVLRSQVTVAQMDGLPKGQLQALLGPRGEARPSGAPAQPGKSGSSVVVSVGSSSGPVSGPPGRPVPIPVGVPVGDTVGPGSGAPPGRNSSPHEVSRRLSSAATVTFEIRVPVILMGPQRTPCGPTVARPSNGAENPSGEKLACLWQMRCP